MAEQQRLTKLRRPYTLRARADAFARTRERITRAAVELHGSVGPAATTMRAVAERAGVTRATLYRHFPNEEALFGACSGAWLAANPPPTPAAWGAIADPTERLATALRELYGYFAGTEAMMTNLIRDAAAMPEPFGRNLKAYPEAMLGVLGTGWPAGGDERLRRAAILHAVAFATWHSLAAAGLAADEAAALMTQFVLGAGGPDSD